MPSLASQKSYVENEIWRQCGEAVLSQKLDQYQALHRLSI